MRRLILATGAAALLLVMVVASVAAAGPMGRGHGAGNGNAERTRAQGDVIADLLGMTPDAIDALRHDGLSLAQIAEQQKVNPQALVDALVTEWAERIEARVTAGALTPDQATALRTQLETRAKDMVYRTTLGGMQGAAVGAGAGNGNGAGAGNGNAPGVRAGAGNAPGVRAGNRGSGEPGAGIGGRGTGNRAGNGSCDGTGPQGNGS